ncbi:MAG: hypothetical protein M1834_000404 [Cirrosporium novae-zelandiae]|nr:MAG: hypothetical protein M1834_000404 [Cirrosporium novae-zelandiae]
MSSSILTPATSLQDIAGLSQCFPIDDIAALGVSILAVTGYLLKGVLWGKPDPYNYVWYERPQEKLAVKKAARKETRNIAHMLEDNGKEIVIFWGSQSGTAEGFANRLAREIHLRFGLDVLSADLSDYDAETIPTISGDRKVIFIVSTYGEGDPSDNAAQFWEWVANTPAKLDNVKYAAFGLGNKNYKFYNHVIDVVTENLDKRGAKAFLPTGRADDSNGTTQEDFMEWKENLFTAFRERFSLSEHEPKYQPTVVVVEDESMTPADLHQGEPVQQNLKTRLPVSSIQSLPVQDCRELFTNSDRNCIHMEINLSAHPEIRYKTGDHIAVWPVNPDVEVTRLLRVLGLSDRKDIPIHINLLDSTSTVNLPSPTSINALLRYYLEICAPVPRDTIVSLVQFAPTAEAKAFLSNLGKSKNAYASFLTNTHLNFGRLLELAIGNDTTLWSNLPLSFVLEIIPRLQPRLYSISSSSATQPRVAAITAVVSSIPLPAKSEIPPSPPTSASTNRIFGLTTNYLLALSHSQTSPPTPHPYNLTYSITTPTLFAQLRKSKFKLPTLASHPIVMVAAGTGIAPFRAFVLERARLKTMGRDVGHTLLFFGCRNPAEDFLYKEELEEAVRILGPQCFEIVTAFSREEGQPKVYVQDRVRERGNEVAELFCERGANFYICGSASMAMDVASRVGEVVKGKNGWEDGELRTRMEKSKRQGRWQEDVWG